MFTQSLQPSNKKRTEHIQLNCPVKDSRLELLENTEELQLVWHFQVALEPRLQSAAVSLPVNAQPDIPFQPVGVAVRVHQEPLDMEHLSVEPRLPRLVRQRRNEKEDHP